MNGRKRMKATRDRRRSIQFMMMMSVIKMIGVY